MLLILHVEEEKGEGGKNQSSESAGDLSYPLVNSHTYGEHENCNYATRTHANNSPRGESRKEGEDT